MVAYRISAADVKLTDARRTARAGFLVRGSFAFFSQLPKFSAAAFDHLSQEALGPILGKGGKESDSATRAAGEGGDARD